ncbi:MAG: hypothetical protein ACYDHP_09710 [Ferrimicrobium sp.]
MGYTHIRTVSARLGEDEHFSPVLHTQIANLKVQMQGTYHRRPSKRYIASYLNEHCFLFNRRHMRVPSHGQGAQCLRDECTDPSRRARLSNTARTEGLVNARL